MFKTSIESQAWRLMFVILALRLRQEDCPKFEPSQNYTGEFQAIQSFRMRPCLQNNNKKTKPDNNNKNPNRNKHFIDHLVLGAVTYTFNVNLNTQRHSADLIVPGQPGCVIESVSCVLPSSRSTDSLMEAMCVALRDMEDPFPVPDRLGYCRIL